MVGGRAVREKRRRKAHREAEKESEGERKMTNGDEERTGDRSDMSVAS